VDPTDADVVDAPAVENERETAPGVVERRPVVSEEQAETATARKRAPQEMR
jgi:hypothetical protein